MEDEKSERPVSVRREPYPDLKALRESRGKSLKDISQKTRIRVAYLESVEQGQFQLLPEPTYAENFIKTYAHEMGINSDIILSRYRKYLQGLAGPKEEQASKERQQRESRLVTISRWFRERLPVLRPSRAFLKILAWTVPVILVVSLTVYFITSYEGPEFDSSKVPTVSRPEKPSQPDVAEQPSAPAPAEKAEPQQTAPTPAPHEARPETLPAGAPLTLVITARETTWVRIVEDQDVSSQFLLRPGDRLERQAKHIFNLDVGNAGGIDVEFQGRSIGNLGKSGEVVHLTLPEERGQ